MNALTAAYPSFKGQSFRPLWKTLTVTHKDSFLGRIKYTRAKGGGRTCEIVSTAGDWVCEVLIPEELYTEVVGTWADQWHKQRLTQLEQTDAEEKSLETMGQKGDYTGRRYTQVLARARPTIDNFFENDKSHES